MTKQSINPNLVLGVVGVTVVYFGILKPIFNKLGLTKGQEDRDTEAATENVAFDPTYYKTGRTILTDASATNFARLINSAFSVFGDNEEQIYTAYRNCNNKAQMSQVAAKYAALYKADLYGTLFHKLSTSEFSKLLAIIATKPDK